MHCVCDALCVCVLWQLGRTALHCACKSGETLNVSALLDRRASVNAATAVRIVLWLL